MANTGDNTYPTVDTQSKETAVQEVGDATSQATAPKVEEPSEADISEFIDITQRLEQELRTIVVGQERVIRELLLALLAGGHVLLEGVPGLGKTLLVRTLSDALTLKFARIQFFTGPHARRYRWDYHR